MMMGELLKLPHRPDPEIDGSRKVSTTVANRKVANVADPNTSEPNNEVQAGDDFADGFLADFVAVPSFILRDPTLNIGQCYLYAVIANYVRIGRETGLGAFPSREKLATECKTSVETISEWLKVLRQREWISWQRRPNSSSLFSVYGPDPLNPQCGNAKLAEPGSRKCQNGSSGNAKMAAYVEQGTYNNTEETITTPLPPTGENGVVEEVQKEIDSAIESVGAKVNTQSTTQPQAHRSPAQVGDRVSNGIDREANLEFWQGPKRRDKFDFFAKQYPKMSPLLDSMMAFRETFGADGVDDTDTMNAVWHGLQWWKEKWTKEGTEEKWIPSLANWFIRRQWEQANIPRGESSGS